MNSVCTSFLCFFFLVLLIIIVYFAVLLLLQIPLLKTNQAANKATPIKLLRFIVLSSICHPLVSLGPSTVRKDFSLICCHAEGAGQDLHWHCSKLIFKLWSLITPVPFNRFCFKDKVCFSCCMKGCMNQWG